jgi:hypothetical protein
VATARISTCYHPPRGEFRLLLVDGHGSHEHTDFTYEAFQNKVVVYYLPPHSSHELQPLDISVFSPLKSRYRTALANLAQLDGAAPVKKQQFVELYKRARSEAMTVPNIIAGFRHAGIVPHVPQVVLRRLQSKISPTDQVIEALATPRLKKQVTKQSNELLIYTPENTRDLAAIGSRFATQTPTRRSLRTIIQKTSKTLDKLQHEHALLVAQNQHYLDQIKRVQPRNRVRIQRDANSLFSSIGNIEDAISRAAVRQQRWEDQSTQREVKKASDEAIQAGYESMLIDFQL